MILHCPRGEPISSRYTRLVTCFPHMSHLLTKNVYREHETNSTCWKSTKAFSLEIISCRIHREDGCIRAIFQNTVSWWSRHPHASYSIQKETASCVVPGGIRSTILKLFAGLRDNSFRLRLPKTFTWPPFSDSLLFVQPPELLTTSFIHTMSRIIRYLGRKKLFLILTPRSSVHRCLSSV